MINFTESFSSCVSNGQVVDPEKMLGILGQLTNQMKDEAHRSAILMNCPDIFGRLEWLLDHTEDLRLKLECYRALRNSMVCQANQNQVRENTGIIQKTLEFLKDTDTARSVKGDPILHRICFQFLINCVIGNDGNASLVGDGVKDFICWYLERGFKEAAYLVNTLMKMKPEFALNFVTPDSFQLFLNDLDSEPNLLCLENLGSNTEYLGVAYCNLSLAQRLSFLDLLITSPCKKSVEFFVEAFQLKADFILKSDLDRIETDFQEILQLTGLVSGFNEMEEIKFLQEQRGFMMTVIHLLKMTKEHNAFEPIEKLTQFSKEEQDHPTFMFKAHLIRLVGNLAFRNPGNQILIGGQCLPIILDYTKIDTLNPFICQWSILAIRNLLEGSAENQNLVRNLSVTGTAYSSVLQEFGLQIAINDEGKPSIS